VAVCVSSPQRRWAADDGGQLVAASAEHNHRRRRRAFSTLAGRGGVNPTPTHPVSRQLSQTRAGPARTGTGGGVRRTALIAWIVPLSARLPGRLCGRKQ
jgi:hypothetical protein